MFGRLGFWEIAIILVIALVIFGPNKLPEMGKALGRGIREFKDATTKLAEDINSESKTGKKASQSATPEQTVAKTEAAKATPDAEG